MADTKRMNMGELATYIRTNRFMQEKVAYARKEGRTRLDRQSTCHLCDEPIRFDGIVWISLDNNDPRSAYRCRVASGGDARRPHEPAELTMKHLARAHVLGVLVTAFADRPFTLLSMPGMEWTLETDLIHLRSAKRVRRQTGKPKVPTYFHAVEKEDAIYRAAMAAMPGRPDGLQTRVPPSWATFMVQTVRVAGFYRGDVVDAVDSLIVDAAWLDFTGPLNDRMMDAISSAWRSHRVREVLVITSLKARWQDDVSESISNAGSLTAWIEKKMGKSADQVHEYADPSPMHQIYFRRPLIWLPS